MHETAGKSKFKIKMKVVNVKNIVYPKIYDLFPLDPTFESRFIIIGVGSRKTLFCISVGSHIFVSKTVIFLFVCVYVYFPLLIDSKYYALAPQWDVPV